MKHLLSFVQYEGTLNEYENTRDLQQSLVDLNMDGLELVPCDLDTRGIVTQDLVEGVHLPVYADWLDFYNRDWKKLRNQFGSQSQWEKFYGGESFETMFHAYEKALDNAQALGANYVVFHVSQVTMDEVFTYENHYTDEEVIDCSVQVINRLLDGKDYTFHFLCENLWWAGFDFCKPDLTKRLMDGIHYEKKGIILDTGHLLCTNLDLKTQGEGCRYILEIYRNHPPELRQYVKAIHLHQSISGEVVKAMLQSSKTLSGDVFDKLAEAYDFLTKVDAHAPWTRAEITTVMEEIQPVWIVHELAFDVRQKKEENLQTQRRLFRKRLITTRLDKGGCGGYTSS